MYPYLSKKYVLFCILVLFGYLVVLVSCDEDNQRARVPPSERLTEVQETNLKSIAVCKCGTTDKMLIEGIIKKFFLKGFKEMLKQEPRYDPDYPQSTKLRIAADYTITVTFEDNTYREFDAYGRGAVWFDKTAKGVYQCDIGGIIYDWVFGAGNSGDINPIK